MAENKLNGSKPRSLVIVAAVYLFGLFMGAVDTGIVTPARTIIENNLQVDEKTGIWMITIYTLAYAASIPIMGKLADKFGRKYIYLAAIFLFGAGSLFCGLSQNFGSFQLLLAARVVQAIGGGGIVPVATAEFGTTFPPEKRGMALGLVGGVYGIANIFGSSAGSAILDIFGKDNWQFIFYVNIPITIFIIIGGLIVLPNNRGEKVGRIDKFGILLIVGMVLSLLYGLKNIDFFNFSETIKSTSVYPFLLIFAVLLPLFILAERKAEDPVMNLGYFTNPRIVITLVVSFITGVVMMGMVFVPQFSENAVKISSGSGGYFVIILGLFAGVGAPLSGRLIDRFGAKKILLLGFAITIIGSLFLIFVTTVYPGMFTVGVCLLLIGLGMGFTIGAPLNYMMLENTKVEESNSALATLSLIRSIGTTIAPAIMVGFIAHAGAAVQDREMAILPKEVTVPSMPYARELTEEISKLKANPNMKDKLSGVELPDLASMTKVKIDMQNNGSFKMPDDLLELLKTSDVVNITDRIKILSARMFADMTPDTEADIQNGVQKGIDGIQSGMAEMDKSEADLQKGAVGLSEGISGMKQAAAGMENGIQQMKKADSAQLSAIKQMNGIYAQLEGMLGKAGGSNKPGSPEGGGYQSFNLLDMMPAQVKAGLPASVLNSLKDVKTLADFDVKISELVKAEMALKAKLTDTEKQHSELLAKIEDSEGKHIKMLDAISSIGSTKAEMNDTVSKMKILKAAVPQTFEKAKDNYLLEIERLRPVVEKTYQDLLNVGFKQVYMVTAVASLFAMLILIFYRKESSEV